MKELRRNKKRVLDLKKVTYNRAAKKAEKNIEKVEQKVDEFKKSKKKESK